MEYRNKIKRRLKEILRAHLEKIPKFDYLISVYPGAVQEGFERLKDEVEELYTKIKERS